MKRGRKCENCRWFEPVERECRASAPRCVVVGRIRRFATRFPEVDPECWCGEYDQKWLEGEDT